MKCKLLFTENTTLAYIGKIDKNSVYIFCKSIPIDTSSSKTLTTCIPFDTNYDYGVD